MIGFLHLAVAHFSLFSRCYSRGGKLSNAMLPFKTATLQSLTTQFQTNKTKLQLEQFD